MTHREMDVRRGQPVLFLALLAAGWIMMRIVSWDSPLQDAISAERTSPAALVAKAPKAKNSATIAPVAEFGFHHRMPPYAGPVRPMEAPGARPKTPMEALATNGQNSEPEFAAGRRALGHSLLYMAAMSDIPMPSSVARWIDSRLPSKLAEPPAKAARWQIDSWLVLRDGSAAALGQGTRPASYGASQAGAVVRYSLAPGNARRPAAYARASAALASQEEREAALGLSMRPIARIPVTAHAEVRAGEVGGRTTVRPAAFLAGGAEAALPLALEAEGYAQAGYVGGDYATGFADGQLSVTRRMTRADRPGLHAGAGSWGGVQRGAGRLDVGPTIRLDLDLAGGAARVAADYRFRVAGNAEPASGVAITLSAGF